MSEELRLYAFNHYKLCGIHAGIQTQHSTQEMNNVFHQWGGQDILQEWANKWKTTIILNGGNSKSLEEIRTLIYEGEHIYPDGEFYESEDDMEGILTNVCIVVPEKVFNFKKNHPLSQGRYPVDSVNLTVEGDYLKDFTEFEIELGTRIASCRLMN